VKVTFTLEQAMKAQKGSKVQLYCFFNLGWLVNATSRSLYPREKRDPVLTVTGSPALSDILNSTVLLKCPDFHLSYF
jgi:hypothetical protein